MGRRINNATRSEYVWCVWRPYSIAGVYVSRAMAQRVRVILDKRIAAKYSVSKMKVRRFNGPDRGRAGRSDGTAETGASEQSEKAGD